MTSKVPSTKVLRPPGGGSSITFGDDSPPTKQKTVSRSPYAVEGDDEATSNKSSKEYTPSKPYGTQADVDAAKEKGSPQVKTKTPYGVEDENNEESKPKKEYTPQKPFATDDANPRPSTKVRKPPGGESHIFF